MTDRDSIEQVKDELRSFSKRHYLNQLLQGLAIFVATSLLLATILSLGEYLLQNSSFTRRLLLLSYLLIETVALIYFVFVPLMRMYGKAGALKDRDMSMIVGNKVKDIEDKLLNFLVLNDMESSQGGPLLKAAIRQKSMDILHTPFSHSANLSKGIRFLKASALLMAGIVAMGMSFPDLVNIGAKRIIFFDREILPPAPFHFELEGRRSNAIIGEPYEIRFNIEGEVRPREVYIVLNDRREVVNKSDLNTYAYRLRSVKGDFSFRFSAEGVNSPLYEVEALERPSIRDFHVNLKYPPYLKMKDERLENTGNLTLPEGSRVTWEIKAKEGDEVRLRFPAATVGLPGNGGVAIYDSTFGDDLSYTLSVLGGNGLISDSIVYRIDVKKDEFPQIDVIERRDSLNSSSIFMGRYSDDHGISSFRFVYLENGSERPKYEEIKVKGGSSGSDFVYEVDWNKWKMEKGGQLRCYFEVWDNDGVNGSKNAHSKSFGFSIPDNNELKKRREDLSKDIEGDLMQALEESRELKKEIENLRRDMVEKKKMDWNEKKKVEDLLRRNESLKRKMEDIRRKNAEKNKYEDKLSKNPELQEKREELQHLMEDVLDEETLKKLQELERMMEEMGKEKLNDEMDNMEISNEQLENELDRSLELYRQLEFEIKLNESIEKISEIQKREEDLTENVEENGAKEELAEEQERIQKDFKDWEKDLDELGRKNEELQQKHDVDDMKEERKEANEEMNQAEESLQKGQKKKSMENQKNASQKMEEMKKSLQALKDSMKEEQNEDVQSLRNTLENLVELSFQQEGLMNEMAGVRGDNPKFSDLTKDQRAILDGVKIVEDSLKALGKRIPQVEVMVNREVGNSKQNMEKALKSMTERKLGSMAVYQQNAMTSLNNLAVLLDEIVDQLQQQMMQSMGQCKKPGNSKPSASSMQQLQEQLNRQLEEMKKMMEKRGKTGENGKEGQNKGEAERLAKMAAEQAKIREELRNLEKSASDKESREMKKIGEMMEETERDIVNREISRETLLRQEEILTKLLESEKSDRERDMDEKRESSDPKNEKKGNLLNLDEYYRARNAEHEEIIKENISFKRYYEERAEEYFKSLSE